MLQKFHISEKTTQAFSKTKAEIKFILNSLFYILENRVLYFFGNSIVPFKNYSWETILWKEIWLLCWLDS